jgi:hypothetical protein
MTNTHQTPITEFMLEPLTYDHMATVQDAQGNSIADCAIIPASEGFTPTQEQEVAIARRFCAAVNACRGYSTEALEGGVIRELYEGLIDLLGDLPSVREHVCRHCGREYDDINRGDCPSDDCPSFKGRAAIAKAGAVHPAESSRPDHPLLSEISRGHLGIPTLETRRSDSLDFHNVAVWQVEAALLAAFDAGARSVGKNGELKAASRVEFVPGTLPTSLLVPKGTRLVPGKMYLRLYHGRIDPDQQLDDWGYVGPTFGPLSCYVRTYCSTFRIFGENDSEEIWLERHEDMIRWDGCFYGDMEVFVAETDDKASPQ